MKKIKTFDFTPISNERQQIHTISFSERIRKGKEGVLRPHRVNFYILLFVTKGETRHLVDFQTYHIKKGDFLMIRPGQVHSFFSSDDSDGTIIAFTQDFLLHKSRFHFLIENSRFLSELSFGCHIFIDHNKACDVDLLIKLIQKEISGTYDDLQEGILQNHLSSLILCLLRIKRGDKQLSHRKSKELLYALQFKHLVDKACGKQYTVLQYAKELGISIRTLQSITAKYFGKSPKSIIQECLLLESKRMLIDPSIQVKEIAYNLGFNDPTNFTKFFKKFSKMSPEQFRNSLS